MPTGGDAVNEPGTSEGLSNRERRINRKLRKLEAECSLLTSSGKEELISSKPTADIGGNSLDELRRRMMEAKKTRDTCVTPKLYLKDITRKDGVDDQNAIDMKDLYSLVLYSVLGNKVPKPALFQLSSWRNVSQSILVVVDQDTPGWNSQFNDFSYIEGNFLRRFNVRLPEQGGDEFYDRLFRIPLPIASHLQEMLGNDPKRVLNNSTDSAGDNAKRKTKFDLLLSPIEMAEDDYPLPEYYSSNSALAVSTVYSRPTYAPPSDRSAVYAIDCEMCLTGPNRSELTRISVVDEQCRVVLDTLVKPEFPVVDYLTRFSGITADMLENVTRTLADVQDALRRILEPDTILCGHSLNFDLDALRLLHPYVIDTSIVYNLKGKRKMKSSLRTLASTFLNGMEIQQSGHGHCSVEDAYATMRLLQRKLYEIGREGGDRIFGNVADGWDFQGFLKKQQLEQQQQLWNSEEASAVDSFGEPSSKRPKVDSTALSKICTTCGVEATFYCQPSCSCRRLDRLSCFQCVTAGTGEPERGVEDEVIADVMVRRLFPPLQGSPNTHHAQFSNVLSIMKTQKKRMLWIGRGTSGYDGKYGNALKTVAVSDSERANGVRVEEFCKRQLEFDVNLVELRCETGTEESVDTNIQRLVKFAAPKSLICVLFCNRREGRTGRCFVKVKE